MLRTKTVDSDIESESSFLWNLDTTVVYNIPILKKKIA